MSEFDDQPVFQELRITEILSDALNQMTPLLLPFIALYLIYSVLLSFVGASLGLAPVGGTPLLAEDISFGAFAILMVVTLMLSSLLSGILTASIWSQISGTPRPIREGISRVMQVYPSLLATAAVAAVFVFLGLLLLIIPGIMIALALAVAVPVVIVENPGFSEALKRSRDLTDGYKMQIFLMFLLMIAMMMGVGLLFGMMAGAPLEQSGIVAVLNGIIEGVFVAYQTSMIALLYKKLCDLEAARAD